MAENGTVYFILLIVLAVLLPPLAVALEKGNLKLLFVVILLLLNDVSDLTHLYT